MVKVRVAMVKYMVRFGDRVIVLRACNWPSLGLGYGQTMDMTVDRIDTLSP